MSSKPIIGILIEGIDGPYQSGVWPGIVDAAHSCGVCCICYCGGSLDVSPQNKWEFQRNSLFDRALDDDLDGYIISGSLGGYIPRQRFMEFIGRFRHNPLISLIPVHDSIPAAYVDNRKGMHDLVLHLIRQHHYKSFSFIQGPEGNAEAQERFLLFKGLLLQHNIALNPETVIKGDFTRECGRKAVDYLWDRKIHVDAIVAAADEIALGALQALIEKGIRVPSDVALVGFDDIPESAVTSPPLTTVSQPMYELGKKAMEMLVGLVRGDKKLPMAVLDASLKIRRSCGCFYPEVQNVKTGISPSISFLSDTPHFKAADVDKFLARLDPSIREFARPTAESFFHDVFLNENASFLNEINTIGIEPNGPSLKIEHWHSIFLELWQYSMKNFNQEQFFRADKLLHDSSMLRVDLERRIGTYKLIKVKEKNQVLRMLGERIANTLDIDLLLDTVATSFPQIGIATFFIFLYDRPEQKESRPKLQLACVDGQRMSGAMEGGESLPALTMSMSNRSNNPVSLVESLYFQNERYGLILFEVDASLYELTSALPEYISSALHSTFLLKEVRRQTVVLGEANAELEALRANEHALLERTNRELEHGRNIQRGFLPQTLPELPGWEIAASFVPARAMSGDFYDAFMLDEKEMIVVIADVCGKDVSAALFMALICTLIRIHSERIHAQGGNPLDAIPIINEYIMHHYYQTKEHQMYTTVFLGLLDVDRGMLRYCNAGQYAPLLMRKNGECTHLDPTGPAVGLIEKAGFKNGHIEIPPDAFLCAFTDGVIDARDPRRDQFSFKRFFAIVKMDAESASHKLKQIETALSDHIQGAEPSDDITILILRRGNLVNVATPDRRDSQT
jgi:serine phosphatase RsbU (regulator of sigma subunit)/DNA-binding LacI/PurR family transcriptional regulator